MNKIVPKLLTHVSQCQHHAVWYHAMRIAERAALLREPSSMQSLSAPANDEEARQRLQRWKEQVPFDKEDYFAQRLALDGLTEDDLLALLAVSPEALQARVSAPPSWLRALMNAFAAPQSG